MIDAILGKKIGMTHVFNDDGSVTPVSVIEAGPCTVTQLKSVETDGHTAVQVGFGDIRPKHVTKPLLGHFRGGLRNPKHPDAKPRKTLREFRTEDTSDLAMGQAILVSDVFSAGDVVKVTGISKGKGFAGVVKRFHFHGGDMTHGSMVHRKPQSSGATDAARTFRGTRKPGHMGAKQVTVRGLTVWRVDGEKNMILIKGPVPGANGGLVTIARI
ncbi:MAG TPA: 50S ribosomal protein L3 [Chthonomonadales bacterium]|nr:50S ribosomal protein L3 [Chthonomonadales bacterium]